MRWLPRLVVFTLLSIACGSEPVPLAAAPGSTIAIAIGGADGRHTGPWFPTGAGHSMAYGSNAYTAVGITDHQRGELRFELQQNGTAMGEMETVLVMRVAPDPSSDLVVKPLPPLLDRTGRQVIALLRVPLDEDESLRGQTYDLVAKLYDRGGNEVPGGAPYYSKPFAILDVDPILDTPLKAYYPDSGGEVYQDLLNDPLGGIYDVGLSYPHPTAVFWTPRDYRAAHLVFRYPDVEIDEILSVYDWRGTARGSTFVFRDDFPSAGQVTVEVITPDIPVPQIALVFEYPEGVAPTELVTIDDFELIDWQLYDEDGNPMSGGFQPWEIF